MRKVVKTFENGAEIGYGKGSFDDWCVYVKHDGKEQPPKDKEYFSHLLKYSRYFGKDKVYSDLLSIFNMVDCYPEKEDLEKIGEIASTYGEYRTDVDIDFTTIYLGMIAEENKANAILKKRMKMLGIYQTLFEESEADGVVLTEEEIQSGIEKSAKRASELSKGVKYYILKQLCESHGF